MDPVIDGNAEIIFSDPLVICDPLEVHFVFFCTYYRNKLQIWAL